MTEPDAAAGSRRRTFARCGTCSPTPALPAEAQARRHFQATCRFTEVTTLLIQYHLISLTDCADEVPPPVTQQILKLLADATPMEMLGTRTV